MAINSATFRGFFVGGGRQAVVVVQDGEEWYEEYCIEDLPSGQYYRNSKVSDLLSNRLTYGMSPEFAAQLPRINADQLPDDFFMPQGVVTVQMYWTFDPQTQHDAIAITRKTNYWKARRKARELGAWFIKRNKGERVYGLLAQLPNESLPRFYSWEEFSEALRAIPA